MKFLKNIEVGSSPNFTLPLSDGSANQILQTNGSGTVTWVDLPSGTTDTNDYVTAAAFNTTTGVVTLTVQNQTAVTVNLDGRYLTAHPNITAASSVNNSGNTYIQDVTLDSNGHVTGLTSAAVTYPFSEFNVADGFGTSNAVADGGTVTIAGSNGIYVSNNGAGEFDIQLKHLGLQSLADPNADRIAFWDDSAGAFAWLTAGSNLTITGTTINATNTNTTYTAGAGLDLTGTVFSLESDLRGDVTYVGSSANDYIQFDAGSGTRMDFFVNGAIAGAFRNDGAPELHCDGDIIAYSSTISDARLKEDVETIENASEKVSQLRGVEYTWSKGSRKGQREIGLIAQEVESVVPSIVREKELILVGGLDDSSTSYKTVDYEKLIALLIESNKEQQDIIAQLEERVIDLENRL
jgi:hypothetical protein